MLVACVAAMNLSACGSQQSVEAGTIAFTGRINDAAVADIEKAILEGRSKLIITSPGGDPAPAIQLAFFIREHAVTVVAEKYCLSACASYVLPASPRPEVRPGTLLGFHNTMTGMYWATRSQDHDAAEKLFGDTMRREQELYHLLGLDPALLLTPMIQVGSSCAAVVQNIRREPISAFVRSRVLMYSPSKATLERFGYRFEGAVPETQDEITRTVSAALAGKESRITWVFDYRADTPVGDVAVMQRQLEALPWCPANLTPPE